MRYQRIEQKIRENCPQLMTLEINDESHMHAGRQGQESHFKVLVVSDDFQGKNRVARQREINNLLSHEFETGLHALSLRILTVEEFEKQKGAFQSPDCQGRSGS